MSDGPLVLAVEDDARNAALLRASLVPAGYRLAIVASLTAARSWLADERPDLVLLDAGLPDGSGLDLARELRASPATVAIPIIVASARVMATDVTAAEEVGCNAFLGKPLNLTELLSTIDRYIGPLSDGAVWSL
jgi:two-component system KDP operon response regulator KdpE